MAPQKYARFLNDSTSKKAGVKIKPFSADVLAVMEEKCDVTYRQSQMLRWFIKDRGAAKLFENCSEKKVRAARRNFEQIVEYVVGTSTLFTSKEGAQAMEDVCHIVLENFDSALGAWAADLDSSGSFQQKQYHKDGEYMLVFGGDTGGRYFKFGCFITHQEKANKGVNFKILFMVEKFKESWQNHTLHS